MEDDLRPGGGYLYSKDVEALYATLDAHPRLAMSEYGWCAKCRHHAAVYHIGTDQVICENCGHDTGVVGVFYTPAEIESFRAFLRQQGHAGREITTPSKIKGLVT